MVIVGQEAVVRSRARYEEAALQHAGKLAQRKSPSRRLRRLSERVRRENPFLLTPNGRPETAVLWKNLHILSRRSLRGILGWSVIMWAGLAVVPAVANAPDFVFGLVANVGVGVGAFLPLILTLSLRNDFRTDLGHLDLVRTWPIVPHRLVVAEVLGPAMVAAAGGLVGAGLYLAGLVGARLRLAFHGRDVAYGLVPSGDATLLGLPVIATAALIVLGTAPALAAGTLLLSVLRNLVVLAFPAWVATGSDSGRGVQALGHRLLLGSVMILGLTLGLLPGGLLVGLAVVLQATMNGPWTAWALPLWGVLAAAPLLVEVALLARLAGRLWSRLDPSHEILDLGR
jgi:hypothetical protein